MCRKAKLTAGSQKGNAIFNGIAHWIKGGVFFWLGIFNLGRWCGCFAEIGWVSKIDTPWLDFKPRLLKR